ncbi:MAG: hypothetical protein ACRC8S_19845 [Fimbriiglobus sp.]
MESLSEARIFRNPPVTETVIGVQFDSLVNFRAHHYGLLWESFFSPLGWRPVADEAILPRYQESFDSHRLNLVREERSSQRFIRQKYKRELSQGTLQFQHDKLYLSWHRGVNSPDSPGFESMLDDFEAVFSSLMNFSEKNRLGKINPNLWEVMYLNQIPRDPLLWDTPADWYRILPGLFPPEGPVVDSLRFATFDGHWHFEIEPKQGRVHVQAAKMVVGEATDPILYVKLLSRGELTDGSKWLDSLNLGRRSCLRLFMSIFSEQIKKSWS